MMKYIIAAGVIAALGLTIFFLHLRVENLTLQRDAAEKRANQYEQALNAYRDAFSSQVAALNTARRQEIARQENLIKTLNLIGDIHEKNNSLISACSLSIIDRLYGYATGNACDSGTAADSGLPDPMPETPGASLPAH